MTSGALTADGRDPQETGTLVGEAVRHADGILMINDAHTWYGLYDCGQQVLRCLHQELTYSRTHLRDELAVILAGQAGPLRDLLRASPALAARFPAVIDFPGYTAGQEPPLQVLTIAESMATVKKPSGIGEAIGRSTMRVIARRSGSTRCGSNTRNGSCSWPTAAAVLSAPGSAAVLNGRPAGCGLAAPRPARRRGSRWGAGRWRHQARRSRRRSGAAGPPGGWSRAAPACGPRGWPR